MDRYDIVVTGLDPARDRAEVLRVLAQRLVKSTDELERLLASAPSTLVRSVPAAEAAKMVTELRALGARVKPQEEAPEIAPLTSDAPPEKIEMLAWSTDEEAPAPAVIVTIEEPPTTPEPERELEDDAPPAAIVVKEEGAWHAPDSRSSANETITAPASSSAPPPSSPARFGRASGPARDVVARPFFRALPAALVMPLRRPRRLLIVAALSWIAMLAAIFCLRSGSDVGPLLGAIAVMAVVGGIGVMLQSSASCLAATRLGEREPSPMASRLMEDYLRPGLGVLIAIAVVLTLLGFVMPELARLHVPRVLRLATLAIAAIYAVTGFALASARGSALGYVDLFTMGRLVLRSPIRASVVTLPTTAITIAASLGLARLLPRWLDAPMPELLIPTGIAAAIALGATYALCFSGAAMGALLRARSK